VSIQRDPKRKNPSDLDDDAGRGNISKEGFGDHDHEFHPATVEIEGDPNGKHQQDQGSGGGESTVDAARQRFEVHFRMMKIRNQGTAFDDYQTPR